MGSQPAASTLDFLLAYQFGAPVARAPARAGVRATRSVGILSPDFFPMYLIGAPIARASAHAGGVLLSMSTGRWSGGSRAPLFHFMRTWAGAAAPPRGRTPQASALWAPERSEGKGGSGTTGDSRVGRFRPQ